MEPAIFENDTGEGVVSFRYDGWYTALLIGGERVFGFGNPCGTCGIVFSRVGSVTHRVSDAAAAQLLGNLEALPSPDVLRRLARVLEPGEYYSNIVVGTVKLTAPGTSDDYFTTDVVRLFGLRDPDEDELEQTPYYRLGVDRSLDRTGRLHSPHKALVTAIAMPLQDPAQLNRERIEYWKRQYHEGMTLTAFAVSILDNQAPSTYLPDPTYPYEEQFLLTLCMLDGHHRVQAAAELGAPIRILSLLAVDYSRFRSYEDVATVLSGYAL